MLVAVRISQSDKEILEKLVEEGHYLNASDAIRAGIRAQGKKCKAQKAET